MNHFWTCCKYTLTTNMTKADINKYNLSAFYSVLGCVCYWKYTNNKFWWAHQPPNKLGKC